MVPAEQRSHEQKKFLSPCVFTFRYRRPPKVSFFMTISVIHCLLQNLELTGKVQLKLLTHYIKIQGILFYLAKNKPIFRKRDMDFFPFKTHISLKSS